MRILVMGTGQFAVPSLDRLMASSHEIPAIITMPLRGPVGHQVVETPIRAAAARYGLPLHAPENINSGEGMALIRYYAPDLLFVCDYGRILHVDVLAIPPLGGINLHGSLLPQYRGAAPIPWAIYNGDQRTGVSVIHMTAKVDAGPIISQSPPIPIKPDETSVEVEARLAEVGSWVVMRVVSQLEQGDVRKVPQLPHLVSFAPKLKKTDGLVPWQRGSLQVMDHYRAMQPWPRAFSFLHRRTHPNSPPLRLLLGPFERRAMFSPFSQKTADTNGDTGRNPALTLGAMCDQTHDARKRRLQENYDFNLACALLIHTTNIQDIADDMIEDGLMTEEELLSKPLYERRSRNRGGDRSEAVPPSSSTVVLSADVEHIAERSAEHFVERPAPGTVLEAAGDRLIVATGTEPVRILRLQPAGKAGMTAEDFLRGYRVQAGDWFDDGC